MQNQAKETYKDKKIRGQTQKYNLRKPLVFFFLIKIIL